MTPLQVKIICSENFKIFTKFFLWHQRGYEQESFSEQKPKPAIGEKQRKKRKNEKKAREETGKTKQDRKLIAVFKRHYGKVLHCAPGEHAKYLD